VKDENGDLLADVYRVSDARQIGIQTAEPLVPEPSSFVFEIVIAKLKNCKMPGSGQIPAELIQAVGEIIQSDIHKLNNSVWNKEEFPDQWNEFISVPSHKNGDKIDCSEYCGTALLRVPT
jgi:hypothetical protein